MGEGNQEAGGAVLPGGKAGEWKLLRMLGKGGASEVWEVEHERFGTLRALKVFMPSREAADDEAKLKMLEERFVAEGKILARLSHPRIVRVHEYGCIDAIPYFVMDLVRGPDGKAARTLADEQADGIDPERVAEWYEDLREGLAYIHSQRIVHRDLKLENVLVGPDGHAVIADFGVSRILDRDLREELRIGMVTRISAQSESARLRMGSRGYFSPELERGEDATPESDIYALGVTVFRLLSGIWYEPGMEIGPILDTYDPLWAKIIPKLLADRPQARSCPSWRELDAKRRMDEAVASENELLAAARARKLARRFAFGAFSLCFVLSLAIAALALALGSARRKLAIPSFSDVFAVPADAPDEERPGLPSREQLELAMPDAWMVAHRTLDDLRRGAVTREKAADSLRVAAVRVRRDDPAVLEAYGDYTWNYDSMAEVNPLAFLLERAADQISPPEAKGRKGR